MNNSLAKLQSGAFLGLNAMVVDVEVDATIGADKNSMVIVGLPDTSVKESRDRVLTAIKHSGFSTQGLICTVNLAPGDLKKEGPLYDLPIALGLISILKNKKPIDHSFPYLVVGELGLGGETRPINGALPLAILARDLGKKGILLPIQNALEASAVPGIEIIGIKNLQEAHAFFLNPSSQSPTRTPLSEDLFKNEIPLIDFSDIKGQAHVKRAMEIVAAGGHNVLMTGPPGSGKTMIAKALIGIMPPLSLEESLEVTKVHSIAGFMQPGQSLVTMRPFRSPHHTISYAGLIGGGANPRPGEVSLAHHGILFLDELPEFSRHALEVLRQPLEDRRVTISRASGTFTYPTNFICIAAMNPCPCGNLGHPDKICRDTPVQVDRYRSKISAPLWDRMDMHIDVPSLKFQELTSNTPSETSKEVRERVMKARQRQKTRFKSPRTNALLTPQELKKYCPLDTDCKEIMKQAIDAMGISARGFDRILRLSLTIADLAGAPFCKDHLMEAINFRGEEPKP